MVMEPSVKAMWVKALTDGTFIQGRDRLRTAMPNRSKEYKYCCLGVLCELYRRTTGFGKWEGGAFDDGVSSSTGRLPPAVCEWAGLSSNNPMLTINGRTDDAIHHNDGSYIHECAPKEFAQIARAIEEQL